MQTMVGNVLQTRTTDLKTHKCKPIQTFKGIHTCINIKCLELWENISSRQTKDLALPPTSVSYWCGVYATTTCNIYDLWRQT